MVYIKSCRRPNLTSCAATYRWVLSIGKEAKRFAIVAEECLQTTISSLSNMMRYFWYDHMGNSGHAHIVTISITKSIIKYGVPGIAFNNLITNQYATTNLANFVQ
ncbi:MAG: hypothetical protein U0586_07965, partial [Candidatus Brocadiaceae bacterium]